MLLPEALSSATQLATEEGSFQNAPGGNLFAKTQDMPNMLISLARRTAHIEYLHDYMTSKTLNSKRLGKTTACK